MTSGLGNTAQSDLLKLLFQNTNWANVGDATGLRGSTTAGSFYAGLATVAYTAASNQGSNEAAYTGYGRVAIARSSGGWTVTGSNPTIAENAAAITFGTSSSGPETEVAACIGRDSAGAGEIITWGDLTANLVVNNGITPSFAINALQATVQ
jgi:hypothetical protein